MKVYLTMRTVLDKEILNIAWAVDQQEPHIIGRSSTITERKLLNYFYKKIIQQTGHPTFTWVGYKIHFILRFLFQRSVILNVSPTVNLPLYVNQWKTQLCDPVKLWIGKSSGISLFELAKKLTINVPYVHEYVDQINLFAFPDQKMSKTFKEISQETILCCRDIHERMTFAKQTEKILITHRNYKKR